MAGYTTAMPSTFKVELLKGQHTFMGSGTATATTTNTSTQLSVLSALTNVARGCLASGTGIPANANVGSIDSATTISLTKAATASAAGVTITFVGDDFKIALGKVGPTGTYDATTTNYSDLTGNSDELAATGGYSTGGFDITAALNTTPTNTTTTAFTTPGTNPSWTSATFSTAGCLMYNATNLNKAAYVGSFGGTQTVTSGTFTILMPTNNSSSALLRIG